jgi:integrase
MAKTIAKLSDRKVAALNKAGLYGDGAGLWLKVTATGSKSWIFRYTRNKKTTDIGLGSVSTVSLAEAREAALKQRKILIAGENPLELKKAAANQKLSRAISMTFQQCSEAYIEIHRHGWKNPKHHQQWQNTLATYCYPLIGQLPVSDIDTKLVIKCLEPIWITKNETASRLRGRIEQVLSWATVSKHREGDNPARWRGHLDMILPRPAKVQKTKHHAALPYVDINPFVSALRQQDGMAAKCLEFTILTACRTNEAIGAIWTEIDFEQKLWIVPADRMKAEREHRIPLSSRCMEILSEIPRLNDFVFAGGRGKGLSNMAMAELLKRMEYRDITVHGFRSCFRDWAAERTNYPHELCEMALAHTIKNQAEAAYRRGDMIEKRRRLMEDWSKFVDTAKSDGIVIPLSNHVHN